ncbi:MAG: hypothetical protein GEV06_01490 [Luteitalea sp.]|nr:hypothetical protein [Luteitalea sp.]
MKKVHGKSRGRPRKRQNTELVSALCAKQDAMARRLAGQVREILGSHVRAVEADWERAHSDRLIRERCLRIPQELTSQVATLTDASQVTALIDQHIRSALTEVADRLEREPCPAYPGRRPAMLRVPGPIKPSRSLALARARCARLAGQLMDLRRSIARTR